LIATDKINRETSAKKAQKLDFRRIEVLLGANTRFIKADSLLDLGF